MKDMSKYLIETLAHAGLYKDSEVGYLITLCYF